MPRGAFFREGRKEGRKEGSTARRLPSRAAAGTTGTRGTSGRATSAESALPNSSTYSADLQGHGRARGLANREREREGRLEGRRENVILFSLFHRRPRSFAHSLCGRCQAGGRDERCLIEWSAVAPALLVLRHLRPLGMQTCTLLCKLNLSPLFW